MITVKGKHLAAIVKGAIILSLGGCGNSSVNTSKTPVVLDSENSVTQTQPVDSNKEIILISFGIYTADKPTEVVKQFRPLLDAVEENMSKDLGKPVDIKMQVIDSYEQGIEDIATGKVDFSLLDPASYIAAKIINPELEILAVETEAGEKVFNGIIAVNKDSPIAGVEDLHGKSFAFGDQLSTIGRFLSQQYLVKHGIKASDLSRYQYLGRHDKVGTSVGFKQFDAGALKEGTYQKLVARGTPIKEIARFPSVEKPWIGRSDLDKANFEQIRDSLLELEDQEVLEQADIGVFVEGSDADYQPIREAIATTTDFLSRD